MFNSKLAPWFIAGTVKAAIMPIKITLEVQRVYWETWHEVFREIK